MKPYRTTQRDLIQGLPERWHENYKVGIHTDPPGWAAEVYDRLRALDRSKATAEEVDAIIGNTIWTEQTCDACDKKVRAATTVGQAEDYETRTATLCDDCLTEAFQLIPKRKEAEMHEPTSLEAEFRRAAEAVATWPKWKQRIANQMFREFGDLDDGPVEGKG